MDRITDWDDAYANAAHIPGGAEWPARWAAEAARFREAHPPQPWDRGEFYLPEGPPLGLAVFVHGGYWMRFGPSDWSHLAGGALARGWAVALPAYPLAPGARIAQITRSVASAIAEAARRIEGPIALAGHSAGGHLATRMVCARSPLPDAVAARITGCLSISGLADLRPLRRTAMNATLRLDEAEAAAESPALLEPRAGTVLTAWVGADERPEFLRQSRLLADIWAGLGAATDCVVAPDRHHFDVVAPLKDADSALTRRWLDPCPDAAAA